MTPRFELRDANFIATKALPASSGSVQSDGFDTKIQTSGVFLARCEMRIKAPALNTTQLPNANTMKYSVQCAPDAGFSGVRTIAAEVIVQTGADAAGAAAKEARFRLPSDCDRYVRVQATASNANNASAASMTVELLF